MAFEVWVKDSKQSPPPVPPNSDGIPGWFKVTGNSMPTMRFEAVTNLKTDYERL